MFLNPFKISEHSIDFHQNRSADSENNLTALNFDSWDLYWIQGINFVALHCTDSKFTCILKSQLHCTFQGGSQKASMKGRSMITSECEVPFNTEI